MDTFPRIAALNVLALACSCGGGGVSGGVPDDATPKAMVVLPGSVTLTLDQGKVASRVYRAYAYFDAAPTGGGSPPAGGVDVSDQVSWSVAQGSMGRFVGSTFRTEVLSGGKAVAASHGGQTTVQAKFRGVTASAALRVRFRATLVSPKAPPGAAGKFGGKVTGSRAPRLVYPGSGVLVPPNLGQLELQWSKGNGNDLFLVKITSPLLELKVITPWTSYNLAGDVWRSVAWTNREGEVTVQVHGTSAAKPGSKGVSPAVTVRLAKQDVRGGLYYWVVAKQGGIYRFDFESPKAKAEPYYTTAHSGGKCVGCHVINRAGDRMAFIKKGGNGDGAVMDVKTRKPIIDARYRGNIQTFSADGKELIVGLDGVLTRREVATGKLLETVPAGGGHICHPDWSPNGALLAFALAGDKGYKSDLNFTNGSIAVLPRTGGVWGTRKVLVQCGGGVNCYYPTFSPLGDWLLFNKSGGDAYSDEGASIHAVRATGGKTVALSRLNLAKASNSWPRWSPFIQQYKGRTLLWLTFSSVRDYGNKLVNSKQKVFEAKRPQIWMAAFDLNQAKAGKDPSFPPFWLPFQRTTESNHVAQWTEKIISIK